MKKWIFVISTLLFAFSLQAKEVYVVAPEYPPYQYTVDGKVQGIDYEIIKEAFKRTGHTVKIEILPWTRALKTVQHGVADVLMAAYKTPEREVDFLYSKEPLIIQTVSLFKHKDLYLNYLGDFTQLADHRLGVRYKFSYGEEFDNAIESNLFPELEKSPDTITNIKKLVNDRLDIVAANKYGALHFLKELNKLDMAEELTPPIQEIPAYLLFTKKKDLGDIPAHFDIHLREMKADGTYQEIIDSYFK